jgi:hypothetical protein
METRTRHPAHPVRDLALQLATGHMLDHDTAETIVARAEQYAEFLNRQ